MTSRMRLVAYFNPTGHHVASWRHPRAQADANVNFDHYIEIAQTAERAKFAIHTCLAARGRKAAGALQSE